MPPPKFVYKRREPEKTDLHRLVRTWFPSLPHMLRERFGPRAKLAKFQPDAVERYLDCGQLANGFVRVRCTSCGDDRRETDQTLAPVAGLDAVDAAA